MVCVKEQRTVTWTCRLTHAQQKHTPYPSDLCVAVISVHPAFHIIHPHSCLFRRVRFVNDLIMNLTWVASLVHTFSDLRRTPRDRPKPGGPQPYNVLFFMIFDYNFGLCVCACAVMDFCTHNACTLMWNTINYYTRFAGTMILFILVLQFVAKFISSIMHCLYHTQLWEIFTQLWLSSHRCCNLFFFFTWAVSSCSSRHAILSLHLVTSPLLRYTRLTMNQMTSKKCTFSVGW